MSNRNQNNNTNLTVKGGVSLETGKGYRGSITLNGKRYRTKRHETQTAARRELNALKRSVLSQIN